METYSVLVVEDDKDLREAISDTIELTDYTCVACDCAESAIVELKKHQFDIVISDIQMPGMSGLELLSFIARQHPGLPVVLITAHATVPSAVHAMRAGAVDYLTKPFEPTVLISLIEQFANRANNQDEVVPIFEDENSLATFKLAKKVASSNATVLVTGESGTGKEIIAKVIHEHSARADKPFVAINCAAIPENMLEATLFGYEKGAYTGAHRSYAGKFEQAQGGTLLLDEVTEMPLALQAKFLRVLQEQEVERLGAKDTIQLDVRVLATSNRDLMQAVKDGEFREDLYFRLNVFPIECMPLRARTGDIIPLAEYFLNKYQVVACESVMLSSEAKRALVRYQWPGNVRELENVIQRALVLQEGVEITENDLHLAPLASSQPIKIPTERALSGNLMDKEIQLIREALVESDGKKQLAAELLGISPRTLRHKMARIREQGIELS